MMHELEKRRQAVIAASHAFKGKPFEWGKYDCVRLAAFVLREMGHKPRLGRGGTYKSAIGAVRALKRAGFDTLADALDAMNLPRIAPLAALPGDIIMVPGEAPFDGALHVAANNGRILGYQQDVDGADFFQPVEYIAAWRT